MTSFKKPVHPSKYLSLLVLLACGICSARADDLATPTPTPTPAYRNPLARRGELRRAEQGDRRRTAQEASQAKAAMRAQNQSRRRSSVAAATGARVAARDREQARRQVAAEARSETAHAPTHPTSDLMARMGFSAQDIAAQKTRETPTTPAASSPSPTRPSPSADPSAP